MSAYALPGLFPPLEENAVPVSTDRDNYSELQNPVSWIEIAIKEAKIDAVKLIESMTSYRPRKDKLGRARRRAGEVIDSTPQEDAMQFEISVSFEKQQYTLHRSFAQLLQLRQDMLLETTRKETDGPSDQLSIDKVASVSIPEVPRLQEDTRSCGSGAQGFVGRGFSFLHAMLQTYTPSLEQWLRKVTSLVTLKESQALTHFLWEPVSCMDVTQIEKELAKRTLSHECLGAIEESDSENDDE